MDGITESRDMSLSKYRETAKDGEAWRAAVHVGRKELDVTELLNNNTMSSGDTRDPSASSRTLFWFWT